MTLHWRLCPRRWNIIHWSAPIPPWNTMDWRPLHVYSLAKMRNPQNCHKFHKLLQRRILQNHMYIMYCSTPGNFRTSLQCNNCHVGSTKNPKNLSVKEYFRWLEMVYHRGSYIKFREHRGFLSARSWQSRLLAGGHSYGALSCHAALSSCCNDFRDACPRTNWAFLHSLLSKATSKGSSRGWEVLSIFGKCQRISKKSIYKYIYKYKYIYIIYTV